MNTLERPPASPGEMDRFWEGARKYAIGLAVGDLVQALVHVWDHFTLGAFLGRAAMGLVLLLVLFPALWAFKLVFDSRRDDEDS